MNLSLSKAEMTQNELRQLWNVIRLKQMEVPLIEKRWQ